METKWLKEALFGAMTSNAFKLGTVLTGGWFWVRLTGCTILYRGDSMQEIDFDNILAVANMDASQISPPNYLPHHNGMTYYYVVRRVNSGGYQEHTLSAAVKVWLNENGQLVAGYPNNVFEVKAKQVAGNKIQLVWYYCPIQQKSPPVCFNLYGDGGTGQIDYENPLAVINYVGRRFYSYQSDTLQPGKYLFAIRVCDDADRENPSLEQIKIQLDTANPELVEIIDIEAV